MTMARKVNPDILPAPSEDLQSEMFAAWLRYQPGIRFTHIPNETWTPSMKHKMRNRTMGVNRGLPDYLIIIPKQYQVHAQHVQLWIEMKRDRTCKPSANQKEWIDTLNFLDNCEATVAYGVDDAIAIVSKQLRCPVTIT